MSNLEDRIAEQVSKEIQEEIDWEIMCDMMAELGWTKIQMPTPWSSMTAEFQHQVREWVRENTVGRAQGRGRVWLFSDKKDATMFALRWL